MKKMTFLQILAATTFLMTAGCASDKANVPNLADELQYNQQIRAQYRVDASWWNGYGATELDKLVQKALENNPDYLKAAINVNKQLYTLNIAHSDLFPTLTSSLGASSQKRLNKGYAKNDNFSGELGLNYEVDLYGKIADETKAQALEYSATVQDRESARLALINSVIDLYFNLQYLQNTVDLCQKNIDAYRDILKITQQRYENGKSDKLEVVQAKQSLVAEENNLLEAQTQFKEMEQSLKNILNLRPGDKLEITYSSILNQKILPVDLNVPMAILANRPDLAAAQYRLQKAFKNWQADEKSWYPTVSMNGALGSSSNKAGTTFDFPYLGGNVSLKLPFLDWNRVKNNIKISEADYEIAVLDFKETLTQALNELAYYDYAYDKSTKVYENIKKNVVNNEQITKYYQIRYDNGKAEFKDLLEAIHTENTSRKNLVRQKYQIIKYENYIYKSMAGRYEK